MVKGGHKLMELAEIAAERKPLVIAITETHLDDSFKDGEVEIPGYRLIRQDRDPKRSKKTKGGGVAVYVREEIPVEREEKKAGEDYEIVAFDMPGQIRYAIMYRPPGQFISDDALQAVEKALGGSKTRLLAGDLNMNMRAKTPVPKAFNTQLGKELKMEQRVGFVTRERSFGGIGSTIDHVWTNMQCVCRPVKGLDGLSDHRAIAANHDQQSKVKEEATKVVWRRRWDEASTSDMVQIIKEELQTERRGMQPCMMTMDNAVGAWDKAWQRIKKEIAPKVKIKVRPRRRKAAWFKAGTKRCIVKRVGKEAELKKAKEEDAAKVQEELKAAAKEAEESIVQAKREFFRAKLADLPNGRITGKKEGWTLWNTLMGRKKKCKAQPHCSADKVNEAFLDKIRGIREPLLRQPTKTPARRDVPVMALREVTKEDVIAALKKDRGTRSVGIDEVPMSVLKRVGPAVADEIAYMTNTCIQARAWPDQWKQAEIVCIWKNKGNQKEPKFYRPISMLPAIARLVERLLADQIKAHIRDNNILPKFQHGFRVKHSTETALIQLVDEIATAMDDGQTAIVASLDLAGAFDTIDRGILIRKLAQTCGISGPAGELLENYLQGRYQRVRKPEETGKWMENPWGVPQGSVLGPLLFVCFCADLQEALGDIAAVQYADDVTLVASADTAAEATEQMNAALAIFQEYATGNRLAVEPTKTQLIVCKARRNAALADIKCTMDGHEIKHSQTMKVLGVTIDNKLTWEQHNAMAAGKASGIARSVARGMRYLQVSDRALLIEALAHPHLDYCQTALARPSAAARNSIRRAYNRTARIAARTRRSKPARYWAKWPEWEERRAACSEAMASR
eukprot:gene4626-biopygen1733